LLGEALHGVEAAALLGGEQQLSLDAPPDTPTCIRRWSESSSIVGVRFERDYLHPEMSRLLAESARRLPEHLDLTERAAANWLQLVPPDLTPCVGHAQSRECPGGSEMIQPDGKKELP